MSVVELHSRSKDRIGWTGQRRKECRLNERARTIVRLNSRNEDAFAGIGNARKMRLLRKGTWHLSSSCRMESDILSTTI
jgi:hypothetical protein